MEWNELAKAIAQLGFPIVVASYLLFRFDRLVNAMIQMERTEHEILERIVTHLDRRSA